MNVFKGLKSFEAVAIQDGGFMAQLPSGEYYIPSRGDGNPLIVSGYDGQQFVFPTLDGICKIVKKSAFLVGFTDADGNPVGSIEDKASLTKQLEDLMKKASETGISNIDLEFEIKKKLAVYRDVKMVYETPPPVKEPMEFTIVGEFKETGSRFIVSSYSIGEVGYSTSGPYKVFQSAIAKDEVNSLIARYPTEMSNSSHTNVRYAKAGTAYIFTSGDEYAYPWINEGKFQIYRTLEDAIAKEEEIRAVVRRAAKAYLKPKTLDDLNSKTVSDIISMVDVITSNVRQTQPMKASRSANSTAYQKCRELIDYLRKLQDE